MEAKGELLPRDRQIVYSALSGKIVEVKAQHGESIAKGQELLLMEDLDLQLQVEQLAIRVSASEQRLAVLAQRLARANNGDERGTLTRELVNRPYECVRRRPNATFSCAGPGTARHGSSRPWRAKW